MIKTLYKPYKKWSEKGSVWIISDTHFEDADCKYMDPNWITPEQHIEILKKYVGKNDTLIHLGDVGNPEWMKKIRCYKVLIMGNHDQSAEKFKPYFHEIYTGPLMISKKIILSHEPLNINWALNIHGHEHSEDENRYIWFKHINLASNVVHYEPYNLGKGIKSGILSNVDSIHRITIKNAELNKIMRETFGDGIIFTLGKEGEPNDSFERN